MAKALGRWSVRPEAVRPAAEGNTDVALCGNLTLTGKPEA